MIQHRLLLAGFLSVVAGIACAGEPAQQPATASATAPVPTQVVALDGDQWLLATDPQNVGSGEEWFRSPRPDARPTRVPWIIQDAFPGYHGVAWYWREFAAPANPHVGGRYLLRFWAVDYKADVWINDQHVGAHEGGEGVFVLDVTAAVRPGQANRLAVRVVNPTNTPIDGLALPVIPRRCKSVPFRAGVLYDDGGIVDSVELLVAPALRVTDLHTRPDPKTGIIAVNVRVQNALERPARGRLECSVSPAASGETLQLAVDEREWPPGETLVPVRLQVDHPRLWELNDPQLYRVTARLAAADSPSIDERSTRCGFRDFRFEQGYFRLNGRRVFLKCSHTSTHYPVGLHYPHDPDLARRDLLNVKAMGFNAIRFFCAVPLRYQLDLCDEIGLMVYEESYAGWLLEDSPQMPERFDREIAEMILRDRNHPSIVMWGLLNETSDGPVFRHAIGMLPRVRLLDDSRIVMLDSGMSQFVNSGTASLGGIARWNDKASNEPNVTFNTTKGPIRALGILWEPGRLALHPGPKGEYCVLRWTAPRSGEYAIDAKFEGISEHATTDVHVLANRQSLWDAGVNIGSGNDASFSQKVTLEADATLDFAVGWGNGNHGSDATGITVSIRSPDGTIHDASRDFSAEKNPNGPWSLGYLAPAERPDAATFQVFRQGEVLGGTSLVPCLANPGSGAWEDVISDQHPYKGVPHTERILQELRTVSEGNRPVFASEYGIGSGVDFARITRHFEQLGVERLEDAQWYRQRLDQFLVDWQRWRLSDTFANPEEFFALCLAKMGPQRLLGLNALRANPRVVGHSITGTVDQANSGEGLFTTFREPKPGTFDCLFDGWYPLRWCLFVEPVNVFRNTPVCLEAVLANEDVLAPGEYPARLQVVAPDGSSVVDRHITVRIPAKQGQEEPPFAMPVFSEPVVIDGPAGKYRFLATFEHGAAAAGGQAEFYVADAAEMPPVRAEVTLWGEDAELAKWLTARRIRVRPLTSGPPAAREVILVSGAPAAPGDGAAFAELARHMAQGATAIFLCPGVFAKEGQPAGWVPLTDKGAFVALPSWLYHKDEWAKRHPIFDGLPAGGLMDYIVYRDLISEVAWVGQATPAEAVAGATNTSLDYSAGLLVSVHRFGAGRFILNTLRIREGLEHNPVAERLLRNMLNYAGQDAGQPPASLPGDFDAQLKAIGYRDRS